mmetsp:Transcript_9510/g.22210  ORF Transcript_9510/g.22210 Transcript_9510/m.22210 type:complete len:279 (-) Transcript_9510:99-935(-)
MRGHGTWPSWRWAGYARERAAKRAPAPRSERINAKRLAASGPRDSSRCQSMDEQRALIASITSRRVSRNIASPISSEYPAATCAMMTLSGNLSTRRGAAFQPAATLSREPSGMNSTGAAVRAAGSNSSARGVTVVDRGARRPCTKGLTLGAAPDASATPEVSANPEAWRIAGSAESSLAGKNRGACPSSRVARITGCPGEVKRPPRRPKRPSGPQSRAKRPADSPVSEPVRATHALSAANERPSSKAKRPISKTADAAVRRLSACTLRASLVASANRG